jgi:hypothetical protein
LYKNAFSDKKKKTASKFCPKFKPPGLKNTVPMIQEKKVPKFDFPKQSFFLPSIENEFNEKKSGMHMSLYFPPQAITKEESIARKRWKCYNPYDKTCHWPLKHMIHTIQKKY